MPPRRRLLLILGLLIPLSAAGPAGGRPSLPGQERKPRPATRARPDARAGPDRARHPGFRPEPGALVADHGRLEAQRRGRVRFYARRPADGAVARRLLPPRGYRPPLAPGGDFGVARLFDRPGPRARAGPPGRGPGLGRRRPRTGLARRLPSQDHPLLDRRGRPPGPPVRDPERVPRGRSRSAGWASRWSSTTSSAAARWTRPTPSARSTDPDIGGDGGYLQVTRLSGRGPALVVVPDGRTPLEAWNPILNPRRGTAGTPAAAALFTDLTPRAQTFEGFFDWMVHSRALAENEWSKASPWNPPTSLRLGPGESRTYGVRFLKSPEIRDIEKTLAAAGRPVAIGIPGYILPADSRRGCSWTTGRRCARSRSIRPGRSRFPRTNRPGDGRPTRFAAKPGAGPACPSPMPTGWSRPSTIS